MAKNYVGMNYRDLNDRQKSKMSRGEFRDIRSAQKEAQQAANRKAMEAAMQRPAESRFASDKVFDLVKGGDFGTDVNRAQNIGAKIARLEEKAASGKDVTDRLAKKNQRLDTVQDRISLQDQYKSGDIDSYNFSSIGKKEGAAGLKDVKFLADQGYSAQEISDAIDRQEATAGGKARTLLNKYITDLGDFTPPPKTVEPVVETPEAVIPDTVTPEPIVPPTVTPVTPPTPGPAVVNPGVAPITVTPTIGGDTGDIALGDDNNVYGTINTGIITDIRNYGGGYGAGENNTGLAQSYIDLMQENWEDYSGPGYGMFITDSRTDYANKKNPIDTNGIYGGMGNFAQNFYDRGVLTSANLYGDPNKFTPPTYGGFPTLG